MIINTDVKTMEFVVVFYGERRGRRWFLHEWRACFSRADSSPTVPTVRMNSSRPLKYSNIEIVKYFLLVHRVHPANAIHYVPQIFYGDIFFVVFAHANSCEFYPATCRMREELSSRFFLGRCRARWKGTQENISMAIRVIFIFPSELASRPRSHEARCNMPMPFCGRISK